VQALELVEGPLGQRDLVVVALADAGDLLVGEALARLRLGVLGPGLLEVGELLLELLVAAVDVEVASFSILAISSRSSASSSGRSSWRLASSTQVTRLAAK